MIGAIRRDAWVTLSTKWRAVTTATFLTWVRRRISPRLRPHDVVVLDNLKAHKAPVLRSLVEQRGATLKHLPPYSHDLNTIEPAWGLVKKNIRAYAPRNASARRVAKAARYVVRPHHCRHAGSGLLMQGTATQVLSGITARELRPPLRLRIAHLRGMCNRQELGQELGILGIIGVPIVLLVLLRTHPRVLAD